MRRFTKTKTTNANKQPLKRFLTEKLQTANAFKRKLIQSISQHKQLKLECANGFLNAQVLYRSTDDNDNTFAFVEESGTPTFASASVQNNNKNTVTLVASTGTNDLYFPQTQATDQSMWTKTIDNAHAWKNLIPPGVIIMYAANSQTSIPAGWLICNGSIYDRTTFADLFSSIGLLYGSTSSNNFRVPDLTGKFVRCSTFATANGTYTDVDGATHDATTGRPQAMQAGSGSSGRTSLPLDPNGNTSKINNSGQHKHTDIKDFFATGTDAIDTPLFGIGGTTLRYQKDGNRSTNRESTSENAHSHTLVGTWDTETAPEHTFLSYLIKI